MPKDKLADVIDTLEGALIPMMRSMLPEPTDEQISLLLDEVEDIYCRLISLRGVRNGDDADTEP